MTVMLGMVLSAIDVSLSVGAAHGDEQVGEAAFGTVVDDATLVPDAGLGLPAVAAHQAALPGKLAGQASSVVYDREKYTGSDAASVARK